MAPPSCPPPPRFPWLPSPATARNTRPSTPITPLPQPSPAPARRPAPPRQPTRHPPTLDFPFLFASPSRRAWHPPSLSRVMLPSHPPTATNFDHFPFAESLGHPRRALLCNVSFTSTTGKGSRPPIKGRRSQPPPEQSLLEQSLFPLFTRSSFGNIADWRSSFKPELQNSGRTHLVLNASGIDTRKGTISHPSCAYRSAISSTCARHASKSDWERPYFSYWCRYARDASMAYARSCMRRIGRTALCGRGRGGRVCVCVCVCVCWGGGRGGGRGQWRRGENGEERMERRGWRREDGGEDMRDTMASEGSLTKEGSLRKVP
jgi:hypothetical protein